MLLFGKKYSWVRCLLTVLLVSFVGAGLFFWYSFGAPKRAVKRNPIMSAISNQTHEWDTRVNLVPQIFNHGMGSVDTTSTLLASGFKENMNFKFYHLDDSLKIGETVWSRQHSTLVCNIEYAVIIKFDKTKTLISANGVIGERGCL